MKRIITWLAGAFDVVCGFALIVLLSHQGAYMVPSLDPTARPYTEVKTRLIPIGMANDVETALASSSEYAARCANWLQYTARLPEGPIKQKLADNLQICKNVVSKIRQRGVATPSSARAKAE